MARSRDDEVAARLRETFLEEASEQLEALHAALLDLEGDPAARAPRDQAFRMLHNLKGSAAGVGLVNLAGFVHEVETMLGRLRDREAVSHPEQERLFEAAEALELHLDEIQSGPPEGDEPAGEGAGRMRRWLAAEGIEPAPEEAVRRSARQGAGRVIRIRFVEGTPMLEVRAMLLLRNLGEKGAVLATAPPEGGLAGLGAQPGSPELLVAYRPAEDLDEEGIRRLLGFPEVDAVELEAAGTPAAPSPGAAAARSLRMEGGLLRVRVERVDALLHLAAELRSSREELAHLVGEEGPGAAIPRRLRHGLEEVLDRQDRLLRRLTEDVLATRMVAVGMLFRRFPRLVRGLARKLGKEVAFEASGEATELDAKLMERLTDPVVHLLRNAVDHGIEESEAP